MGSNELGRRRERPSRREVARFSSRCATVAVLAGLVGNGLPIELAFGSFAPFEPTENAQEETTDSASGTPVRHSLSQRARWMLDVVEREHPDDVDLRALLHDVLATFRIEAAQQGAGDAAESRSLEMLLAELDRLPVVAAGAVDREPAAEADPLSNAVLSTIAEGIPGGARYVDAAARKVDEQLRQNRYVGIGIRLRSDEGDSYIESTFYGGPAAEAGLKAGDRFVTIDGVSTVGLPLGDVVERLRGPLGSTLETTVWRDGRALSVRMTRTEVPIATIESVERTGKDRWNVALPEEPRIAWLKFVRVAGSSVAELRSLLRQADEQGCRAALIDLRGCDESDPHQIELLADLLTDGGSIGEREIGERREAVRSQAGGVWLDRPIVFLIDRQTADELAWGVAAIARRDDVRVIGDDSAYRAMVREDRELADGGVLAGLPIGRLRPVAEGVRNDDEPSNRSGAFRLIEVRSIPSPSTGSEPSPTDDSGRAAGIEIARELLVDDRPK